jgi:hypothetical protein
VTVERWQHNGGPSLGADGPSFVELRPSRAAVAGALLATAGLGTALQDYAAIDDAAAAGGVLARAAAFGGVAMIGLLAWRGWRLRELPVRGEDHCGGGGFVMAALGYVLIASQQFLPPGTLAHHAWPLTLALCCALILCILVALPAARELGEPVLTPSVVMPSTVLFLAAARATPQGWPQLTAAVFAVALAGWLAALASAGAWRLADRHLPHTLILAAPPSLASIVALEWARPLPWLAPGFASLGTLFWVGAVVFLVRRGVRLPLTGACWALVFPTTAQAHALHSAGGTFGGSWMQSLAIAQLWFASLVYLTLWLAFALRWRRLAEAPPIP